MTSSTVQRLREISREILADPRRIRMRDWLQTIDTTGVRDDDESIPPCGTIGCIAGWAVVLESRRANLGSRLRTYPYFTIKESATSLLELSGEEADRLFFPDQWPDQFRERERPFALRGNPLPQTLEYARVVVERIEFFIATGGTDMVEVAV